MVNIKKHEDIYRKMPLRKLQFAAKRVMNLEHPLIPILRNELQNRGLTSDLEALDLAVENHNKEILLGEIRYNVYEDVLKQLEEGVPVETIRLDLKSKGIDIIHSFEERHFYDEDSENPPKGYIILKPYKPHPTTKVKESNPKVAKDKKTLRLFYFLILAVISYVFIQYQINGK